ncbi:uncharacterized protein V6R79_004838 [Siganus canaliculatus]
MQEVITLLNTFSRRLKAAERRNALLLSEYNALKQQYADLLSQQNADHPTACNATVWRILRCIDSKCPLLAKLRHSDNSVEPNCSLIHGYQSCDVFVVGAILRTNRELRSAKKLPNLTFADIYIYLVHNPSPYTGEALKAFKCTEAYRYFTSGNGQACTQKPCACAQPSEQSVQDVQYAEIRNINFSHKHDPHQ